MLFQLISPATKYAILDVSNILQSAGYFIFDVCNLLQSDG